MKPILIKQPKGLGDIFFCQKIAFKLYEKGHRVIWPVISKYVSLKSYLSAEIEYVDEQTDFDFKDRFINCRKGNIEEYDNCIVIATDGCAESGSDEGVMISKYKLVGLSFTDWLEYFNYKRNYDKEAALIKLLNLNINEEYTIINRHIGGPGDESVWDIVIPKNTKKVELTEYPGYTLFDWSKILECASAFYTMETGLSYIIEKLKTQEKNYIMYHRSPSSSPNCKEFFKIYKKPQQHIGCEFIKRIK